MFFERRDFIKILGAGSLASTFPGDPASRALLKASVEFTTSSPAQFSRKKIQTDVLVAGGGLSGVCAAIAAARNGARVVLVQDRSRLGGNASSEIRMHVLGANNHDKTRNWRETGIIEELKLTESATNPQRSFEMWDLILYDKVVSESNMTLLLDTAVIGAEVKDDRLTGVRAVSSLLEEYYDISADYFIDCTGDATLGMLAGAICMRGREGKDVYGESLAADHSDNKTMGNSILFFAKKHERPMPFVKPVWAETYTKQDFEHRRIYSYEYGFWWIEWGGELDTIKDNREIRHHLLKVVLGVWDYIKNSGEHPDSANWALDWVGMIPGKRESRRLKGEHVMIQQEMEDAEEYPDRVAYGGWPMDDHPPCGMDCTGQSPFRSIKFDKPYNIPLRSLYSINRPNLLMAGRNISASHVAFSSTRVMATCAAVGQAAGTAAAYCKQKTIMPRDITAEPERLTQFLQLLLRDDQSLLNVQNTDPEDLARNAKVTVSKQTKAGPASRVIDGWNREKEDGTCHQWQAPAEEKPWLELRWESPQKISKIQLVFDTGLDRVLYLTGSDGQYNAQIRGAQPETVADYEISANVNGEWKTVCRNSGNYLRLVRHIIEPIATDKIRIIIFKTNGDTLARIWQVSCFS
ncbi:FAD-dependent oxidoreductase [candidate division KSB1 bacterium]|nr:FAD-dependent oxidoreductase [candidate division KSB1 bacterium]